MYSCTPRTPVPSTLTQISTYEMVNPIHANPTDAVRRLTIGGSDWLWVVFTIMVLSALGVFVWSQTVCISPRVSALRVYSPLYRKHTRGKRAFHYLAVVILTVSSLAYFAMASDLGQTSIRTEFRRGATRSIFVCFFPSSHCFVS